MHKLWVQILVSCKRESASSCLSFPLFIIYSFSPVKFFVTDFSSPKRARVFKFCIHLQTVEVSCVKENHIAEIPFDFFLPFFSISHFSVMHRESCVQDYSGTAATRILKFEANIGYGYLYCIREIQHSHAYHSLHLSIFLFLK